MRFTLRAYALSRVPRMAPNRVAELQTRRLRALVGAAVERSPFFRAKYRGINLDRFALTDLPPSHKTELMAHFDEAVTDPAIRRAELERFIDDPRNEGTRFLGRYVVSHTSGSQGQPMLILQEPRHLELLFGLQMTRGNTRKANLVEAVRRLIRPERLAVLHLDRDFFPTASAFEHMPAAAKRYVKVLRLAQTDADLIERLNAFEPNVLTAYAGVLEILALEELAGRLHLRPRLRQVVSNSEVLTDRARERIESAFGLHVLNNYAVGECPFLTTGCTTDDGSHVNADWAILEVVDDAYRPVPAGTPGTRVLVTNLANTTQPIIRYEIGDVVTMADAPCGCGSRLPRVARIEGRDADIFWIRDGSKYRRVITMVFTHAFEYLRQVREWQAIQTDRNRVQVRLELLPNTTLDETHARRILDRQMALYGYRGRLDVALEVVPRLEPDSKTGKFRRMISLVGVPDDLDHEARGA